MAIVVTPADGTPLSGEFQAVVQLRGRQTGGALASIAMVVPPRRLIPPHVHANDVWVYVLSGEIGILVGDEIDHAGPGSWALKPRDITHSMWNRGETGAHIIEVMTPAGSERWFEEVAALSDGDHDGFEAACQRHRIKFFPDSPWIAELRRRFALK